MFPFGSASCPFLEGPEVVSEGSAASWIKWPILNVMLVATYKVGTRLSRNKDKIPVAELISRAKGTEYAHALGNLMEALGQ